MTVCPFISSNSSGVSRPALSNTASGTTFNTTNETYLVTGANNTSFWWRAEFTSSDPLLAGVTECEVTTMTIDNNPG